MKRFTWWRMEQDGHHLSRALCGAFCSILHHVKRFMSQPRHCKLHHYTLHRETIRMSMLVQLQLMAHRDSVHRH